MSCERFRTAIAAHAAGADLDPATARHLGGCAGCRRLLDAQAQMLAELDAELGRSLSISASPGFAATVARAAREAGSAPPPRWIPAGVWAGLGLAAAIALAVWVRQAPVGETEAFRLKAEATQPQEISQPREKIALQELTKPRADAIRDCVASGFSRKAATGGCGAAPLAGARPGTRPRPHSRRPNADPPVIVEPARVLAIQRLRELIIQGRLNEKMLPPPVTPDAALAELTIAPLEIAEIRVPDVEIVAGPPAAPQRQ